MIKKKVYTTNSQHANERRALLCCEFLFKINSVSDGKGALDANQQALLKQQSAHAVARQELSAYIENLKQSAVITRY